MTIGTVPGRIVLDGIVGSTAYGLDREGSDVDFAGVFVAPTREIAGLNWSASRETRHISTTGDDFTYHEVGKFLKLALKGNPTILELMWLPVYNVLTPDGGLLVDLRRAVLSRDAVRNSYLGYARSQNMKLKAKADPSHPRLAKMGRHMLRLIRQGRQFAEEGRLVLRVDDPYEYYAFDDMSVRDMLEIYARDIGKTHEAFDRETTALPEKADVELVSEVLWQIRRRNLE
jgi:predicted nucleotidyltransferase